MSTTPSQPTKTGLQDFNAASSIVSASSAYQLYYIRFYSPTHSNGPSSYALGYRPRWGTGPIDASTTIYIGCAPGTTGRTPEKPYRQTNIAAEKRERKAERADVYWLGKINNMDRLVKVMGNVNFNILNGVKGTAAAQKIWCERVVLWINLDSTWVVSGWVRLPKDEERIKRFLTLGG
ncbi:hypothetical protein NHQ30_006175 [Ciborinia camelliae]|nr:hypothetical protein NHQ30_006175 [Ciborinia camelliae]